MSGTLTITGNMAMPSAPGGSTTQILIGAPDVVPGGNAASIAYNEKAKYEFTIAALATKVVDFGTIADGKFLYIGTDKAITYKLSGGSDVLSLDDGGFMLIALGGITAVEITAGPVEANPFVVIVGD